MSVARHHDGWLIRVDRGNAADDQYLWITDAERELLPGLLKEPRRLTFRDGMRIRALAAPAQEPQAFSGANQCRRWFLNLIQGRQKLVEYVGRDEGERVILRYVALVSRVVTARIG